MNGSPARPSPNARASRNGTPRVTFVDRGLAYHGGVPNVLLNFAKYADPSLIRVHVASLKPSTPDMSAEFDRLDVPLFELGDDGYVKPALALRRCLRSHAVDVVVANTLKSYLVAKLATLGTSCKVVYWMHAVNEVMSNRVKALVYTTLSRRDSLMFVSNATRNVNLPRRHRGASHVIYNGVEHPDRSERWRPYERARRAEFGFDERDFVILYTASFEELKNHRVLLEAFEALLPLVPNARLVLVGRGELLEAMRSRAQEMSGGERVHFLGARPDARRLLGLADVYVHPSYIEAFGLVVVEAMLARVPVIVANTAALPELVRHGETGLLFDAHDPRDLTRNLAWLAEHPVDARRFATAAYEDAATRFSPERFASEITGALLADVGRAAGTASAPRASVEAS
ncbi:glycosyltransferase family 4 protein [Deinococcus yavapaiensis]|uniref:glycosyltransferase family 4 protein n=1 Tax=Deinococcus yavapaiensis TaxID=309889 RepID=UPI0014733F88|nr:glycosyltransferase family 4 protein [Deinococcus yavapaiensis]